MAVGDPVSQSDNSQSSEVPGGWGSALEDLAQRRAAARAMGGEERLAKKHAKGQLDARGRIESLWIQKTAWTF